MTHFVLKSIDTSPDASLPKVVPLCVGFIFGRPGSLHVDDLIVTDDGLLQTSSSSNYIWATLISMPTMPTTNFPYSSVHGRL